VLRPGVLLPTIGYAAAIAAAIGAVVLAIVAPMGGHQPFPKAGDWHALSSRLIAGEICGIAAWCFYKVASNKVILSEASMQVITFMFRWTINRDEISDVKLVPSSMVIMLTDGCIIRPSMFWLTPAGALYFGAGLRRNAVSRNVVRDEILRWRQAPEALQRNARAWWPCRRHWSLRPNLILLTLLVCVVAAEAIAVTATV
jgi:hypothetical protein